MIIEHHKTVLERLIKTGPKLPAPRHNWHVIPANATYADCLSYADHLLIDMKRRYNEYRGVLRNAFSVSEYQPAPSVPVLHLDIGCGPGLFMWAVLDQFREGQNDPYPIPVTPVGYDSSSSMLALAHQCYMKLSQAVNTRKDESAWSGPQDPSQYFPRPHLLSGRDDLRRWLEAERSSVPERDIMVTFGHVLAQNFQNSDAIYEFTWILQSLAELPFRRFLVLTGDATAPKYGPGYRAAWSSLSGRLKTEFQIEHSELPYTSADCIELLPRKPRTS